MTTNRYTFFTTDPTLPSCVKSADCANFHFERWEKALEALSQSAELNPRFSKTHYLMAIALEQTGRRGEAIEALDRYLRLEPNVETLFNDPYFQELVRTPEFSRLIRRHL